MSSKPNDFKVGLFVLVGIVLLLAALFIFGASKWFEGKTVEETYVEGTVDGLKVGAPVTLRGVPVGHVTRINFTWNIYHELEPRYVYVEFEVDRKVSLAPPGREYAQLIREEVQKGLRARIRSQGLAAGTSLVSLEYLSPTEYPPLNVPWTPRHIYIPSAPGPFSEIMAGMNKTIAKLTSLDFQKIGTLVAADLAAGGLVLTNASRVNLAAIGDNLNQLVGDLRTVTTQLHTFIGNTNQLPQASLEELSQRAGQLLAQVQSTVAGADQKIGSVNTSALNDTLDNLQRVARDLDQTINQIKQYPSGAIFGRPPEPARSVEPPRR